MTEVDDKLRAWWEAKVQRLEAELQKRDQEIERLTPQCEGCMTGSDVGVPYGGIAYAHPNCPIHGMQPEDYAAETARIQTTLNVTNQLLEQTIEVLEDYWHDRRNHNLDGWWKKAKPLLDKLQALKKEPDAHQRAVKEILAPKPIDHVDGGFKP